MVGDILMDTLRYNLPRLRRPAVNVSEGQYLVFTLNRRALLADEDGLRLMLQTLITETGDMPIVAPLRDSALGTVVRLLSEMQVPASKLKIESSLPYLEFGWLTAHACGIVTDSGNVAEEATFNGVPCITLNDYTEHQETVTVGTNVLVGGDPEKLRAALADMVAGRWKKHALPDRWDGRTAERIVSTLLIEN
jgi:UDP-N-acetylglucosamine 2-epimerase (non-hydrolysing)